MLRFQRPSEGIEAMNVRTRLTVSMSAQGKTNWDLFIMLLATYNCYQIPIDVAFAPAAFGNTYFKVLHGLIDLLFLVDILVSFRTTFMDDTTGDEISDGKRMAITYLKG